jgi:hypothetical protein
MLGDCVVVVLVVVNFVCDFANFHVILNVRIGLAGRSQLLMWLWWLFVMGNLNFLMNLIRKFPATLWIVSSLSEIPKISSHLISFFWGEEFGRPVLRSAVQKTVTSPTQWKLQAVFVTQIQLSYFDVCTIMLWHQHNKRCCKVLGGMGETKNVYRVKKPNI